MRAVGLILLVLLCSGCVTGPLGKKLPADYQLPSKGRVGIVFDYHKTDITYSEIKLKNKRWKNPAPERVKDDNFFVELGKEILHELTEGGIPEHGTFTDHELTFSPSFNVRKLLKTSYVTSLEAQGWEVVELDSVPISKVEDFSDNDDLVALIVHGGGNEVITLPLSKVIKQYRQESNVDLVIIVRDAYYCINLSAWDIVEVNYKKELSCVNGMGAISNFLDESPLYYISMANYVIDAKYPALVSDQDILLKGKVYENNTNEMKFKTKKRKKWKELLLGDKYKKHNEEVYKRIEKDLLKSLENGLKELPKSIWPEDKHIYRGA